MREVIHGNMRKTGWSLSAVGVDSCGVFSLVREDREELTSGGPAVAPAALPGSYVGTG